jgi:hypothetical protein
VGTVLAADGGIDLVAGAESDVGSIEGNDIGYFFPPAIYLYGVAIDHVPLLVLVHHISKILVGKEIDIDQPVIGHIVEFLLAGLFHLRIIDRDKVLAADAFEDQEIPRNLTDDLEIDAPDIVFFRFGINDPLGEGRGGKKG